MGSENYKPVIVMIACQFIYAGTTLSARAALLEEMSSRVFVVYRQCIGFLLIAPFAFSSRRGKNGCRLGWKNFWWIFLLSFVGLIGGLAAIIGLYIVLWGKAEDNEEVKEGTTSYTQVSDSCKIDLEEPLLPEKPTNLGDYMRD